MPNERNTEAHSAPGLTKARVPWWVTRLTVLEDFRLAVVFGDGTEGEANLRALIFGVDAGVFAQLRNPAIFAQAFVEDGVVTWPNGLDIAPDAMYDVIRSGVVFTG